VGTLIQRQPLRSAILLVGSLAVALLVLTSIWLTQRRVPEAPGATPIGRPSEEGRLIGPETPPVPVAPSPSSADAGERPIDDPRPSAPAAGAAAPASADHADPETPAPTLPLAAVDPLPVPQAPTAPPNQPAAPLAQTPQSPSSVAADGPPPPASAAPRAAEGGGWVVQLSAQKTEAEAQAAFRAVQTKYSLLGSYQPLIRKKDLGGRGVFYAAQVGPLTRDEAKQLCVKLKSAGGSCFIRTN
jgi:SPOR domain